MPAPRRLWLEPRQWRLWISGIVGSRYDGLAHFAVVEPGALLRCGQPHVRDLECIHRQHALRTVLCARGGTRNPIRNGWFRAERRFCEQHDIAFVHERLSDTTATPTAAFERFVELARDPQRRPILVHCEQGWHRTGVLCAAYRIAIQGWPIEDALREMESLGFELHNERRRPLVDALIEWARRTRAATPR